MNDKDKMAIVKQIARYHRSFDEYDGIEDIIREVLDTADHWVMLEKQDALRAAAQKMNDALDDAYEMVSDLPPGQVDGLIDKIERAQIAYKTVSGSDTCS